MQTHSESHLLTERREKLNHLRQSNLAYPNHLQPSHSLSEIRALCQSSLPKMVVQVAGRMTSFRRQGKISFISIQDTEGHLQLFVSQNNLSSQYQECQSWDVGDIVWAEGVLMETQRGELSLSVSNLQLLTKSLRPLPFKQGLEDVEVRYRQRYVDLAVNAETRQLFILRSRIIQDIRHYLHEHQFLELETPMMHPIPGGANARPFITHYNALDLDMYLRIAPELYLKRAVVGGLERVYELNRNFRNEGVSTRHNPEFTMLEVYQSYATYETMMDLLEGLLHRLVERFTPEDFSSPSTFHRQSMSDLVLQYNPSLNVCDIRNTTVLQAYAQSIGIRQVASDWGSLLLSIFEETVERNLITPTFVTHYPRSVSPLARSFDDDVEITERFELFIGGREIANGFSELNDPEEQARRFQTQVANHAQGDEEAMLFDADYIRALEYGMPPTGGLGLGIDRLIMWLTHQYSIRDVLLFPYLKPENP